MVMHIDESEMILTFEDGMKYPIRRGDVTGIMHLPMTSKPLELNDVQTETPPYWDVHLSIVSSIGVSNEFKRNFLMFAYMTIVAPSTRIDGDRHLYKYLIDHQSELENIDGVGYTFKKLRSGIRELKLNGCSPSSSLQGCMIFLELFYWTRFTVTGCESPSQPDEWTSALVSKRVECEENMFSGFSRAMPHYVSDLRPDDLQESLTCYQK